MNRNVRTIREITSVYDELIKIARLHVGKRISMEWGTWIPSERGLQTLMSRRSRILNGAISQKSLIREES